MKGLFLFSTMIGSLFCTSLCADKSMQDKSMNNQMNNGDQDTSLRHKVNLYETYDNNGVNLGVRADFLYMNYSTPVFVYAADISPINDSLQGTAYAPKPKPEFGCDIALTYTMHDAPGYTFEAGWFYMRPKFTRTVTDTELGLTHVVDSNFGTNATATNSGHININFIDLLMGKDFAWGETFRIGPFGGLLGGFMFSKNTANAVANSGTFGNNSDTNVTFFQQVKYKGIGVKVGTNYDYRVWGGLSIKGSLSYNMLYGFSRTNMLSTEQANSSTTAFSKYRNHHGRSFVDSLLGLAWGGACCDDSMYFDVHVQWRYQAFSDGWMQLEADWNHAMQNLPLYGQGLQAGLTWKF